MARKATTKNTAPLKREFKFNGVKLEDPSPSMEIEQVRDFYAVHYPEIGTAGIKGPVKTKDAELYTFEVKAGTKG